MPDSAVIPVLHYPDVRAATEWLCAAFGFRERLKIGSHRAQLSLGPGLGDMVVAAGGKRMPESNYSSHSIMVRVSDIDRHYERSLAAGARIASPPQVHPYGEKQYTAVDPGGHAWNFSQTIADVDPASWGGVQVE